MALDRVRNRAYCDALREAVGPGSVVLDVGAGIGVHGLMAARLGARRVYLVDPEDILEVAREVVRANGLDDVVRCLRARIQDVQLPERADVIVSALTGNFLVTEDLLETLFFARDHMLAEGGTLIPSAAVMEVAPVSAPELHEQEVAGWSAVQHGVDLSAARPYAANTVFYRRAELAAARWLAEPATVLTLDFRTDPYRGVHAETSVTIEESNLCHGWVGWFKMQLGSRWLSTSPRDEPVHWTPAYLPLDPPIRFEKGERVSFALDRMPFGDWTWRVRSASATRQHSTLQASPLTTDMLRRAGLEYRPVQSEDARLTVEVLAACDGSRTVRELAAALREKYPSRLGTELEARRVVQRIIGRLA